MRRVQLLLSIVALAGLLAGPFSGTRGAPPAGPTAQASEQPVVVRLYFVTRANLDRIASHYDVLRVQHDLVPGSDEDRGYALLLLSPTEHAELQAAGYRTQVDDFLTAQVRAPSAIPDYPCYRSVEETYATVQALAAAYPSLVELNDIGDSWDKATPGGAAGYDIWALRITNEDIPGPKPRFFLMAEIHAREMTTAETATRTAEHILARYGSDPTVTFFVDYHELYIVPMTNPDGRKIAEGGVWWRKNVDNDDGCSDPNNWGTDLNRNYNFMWDCCGGGDDDPCGGGYHGPSRGSEPETRAISDTVVSLFPDQNGPNGDDEVPPAAPDDATGILITLHSAAGAVLWPWGFSGGAAPNGAQLQAIGERLAAFGNYIPMQSFYLYLTDGTTDDWSYGKLGIASFTVEMGRFFFENCSYMDYTVYPNNRDVVLYAWKIARTPYVTAFGPDTLGPSAAPVAVEPGSAVQLTAAVDDNENGGQNVAGAEYYLLPLHAPTPPGDPGSGTPMLPADGSWNSPHEEVVATVDTTGQPTGTYLLAVRGVDAGGNWGPLGAAFLYLVDPASAPVVEGYVRDAGSGAPVAAAVTAGLFRAASDPATGYYSLTVVSGTYDVSAAAPYYATATAHGVVARDYQVTQQDLDLFPSCAVFSDNMESGPGNWTTGGNPNLWQITAESYHSPLHAWSDSPWSFYFDNTDSWVQSGAVDLSGYSGVELSFWHTYQTEPGYDYGYVEYSGDGGSSWALAGRYDGDSGGWRQETIPLPALDGQSDARIRFHFFSDDASHQYDGWHFDDVRISAGGPACPPLAAPTAEFSSTSPVLLGQPVYFTNQSTGNPPPTYLWDFGDGVGSSTEVNPAYTYATTGTFTVTLTATNVQGSAVVSHSVEVLPPPCEPVHDPAFAWAPLTPTVGQAAVFTATAAGTLPMTHSWNWGDGSSSLVPCPLAACSVTHTYALAGPYTVALTATNCATATATVTHALVVQPPCQPVTATGFTWQPVTPTVGQAVTFTGTATGTLPVTYSWRLEAGSWKEGPVVTHSYSLPGLYNVVLTATNCATATATATHTLTVVPACEPVWGAAFTWQPVTPTVGEVVVFTGTATGTLPITYSWRLEAGSWKEGPVVTHSYSLPGLYTVALTATNCTGAGLSTAVREVTVAPHRVYLPLVFR